MINNFADQFSYLKSLIIIFFFLIYPHDLFVVFCLFVLSIGRKYCYSLITARHTFFFQQILTPIDKQLKKLRRWKSIKYSLFDSNKQKVSLKMLQKYIKYPVIWLMAICFKWMYVSVLLPVTVLLVMRFQLCLWIIWNKSKDILFKLQ